MSSHFVLCSNILLSLFFFFLGTCIRQNLSNLLDRSFTGNPYTTTFFALSFRPLSGPVYYNRVTIDSSGTPTVHKYMVGIMIQLHLLLSILVGIFLPGISYSISPQKLLTITSSAFIKASRKAIRWLRRSTYMWSQKKA